MERFEEFKDIILNKAKEESACKGQYQRALKSGTFEDLISIIKDNFQWSINHKIIDPILIKEYKQEFNVNGIWCNENICNGFLLATGNATVRAYGNATVEAYGNATVEAYGNATVRAYDNAIVEATGNATVEAYGNATVRAYGNAYIYSYYIIECKLKDNAVYRLISENKIFYPEETAINIEKQTTHKTRSQWKERISTKTSKCTSPAQKTTSGP
jgi:hypothetical protein